MLANKLNLNAYTSAGAEVIADRVTKGVTLGVGTYYVPVPSEVASEEQFSIYLKWAAAVNATITIEATDFEDVTEWSTTAGDWVQVNPTTAYVPVSGASNSATLAVVTAGGAAIGSALFEMSNIGGRRWRLKIVTTVGGLVRIAASEKRA